MKKIISVLLASLFIISCLTGCQNNNNNNLPNPISDSSYDEIKSDYGINLLIPDDASDAYYSIISRDSKTLLICQVGFKYDKGKYNYRGSKVVDDDEQLSGVYYDFPREDDFIVSGIKAEIEYGVKNAGILAKWDIRNIHYSLYAENLDESSLKNFKVLLSTLIESNA